MKDKKSAWMISVVLALAVLSSTYCNAIDATVRWNEPTYNVNGKKIIDLEGFFLYLTESQDQNIPAGMTKENCVQPECTFVPSKKKVPDGAVMEYTFTGLEDKRYFLRIISIDEVPNYDVKTEYKDLSKPPVLDSKDLILPVDEPATVSSCYGSRTVTKAGEWHDGIDFAVPEGTEVKAVADGTVLQTCTARPGGGQSECGGFGGFVYMKHDSLGTYSQYSHLSKPLVKQGDAVKRGQVIGLSGNTGRSTGPHLDFRYYLNAKRSIRKNDPLGNPLCYLSTGNIEFDADSCRDADGTGIQSCPGKS